MKKLPLKQRLRQLGVKTACPSLFTVYTKDYLDTWSELPGNIRADAAYRLFSDDIREDRFLSESVCCAADDPQRLYKLLVEPFALAAIRERRENRTIL